MDQLIRTSTLRVLSPAIAIALLAVWLVLFRPAALGGNTSYVFVQGASMEPSLRWGDLAVVRGDDEYEVGDVVAYRIPEGEDDAGKHIIHRITGGNATAGYDTQGDNTEDPDLWHPKPEDIVGKLWFHVPAGASWLQFATRPMPLIAICGVILITMMDDSEARRPRRRGRRMLQRRHSGNGDGPANPGGAKHGATKAPRPIEQRWLIRACALLLVAVGLTAVAAYGFFQASRISAFDEHASVQHSIAFDYTVHTAASEIYPDGIIGPVEMTSDPSADRVPIYTKLARTMDLGIAYSVNGIEPESLRGELSAVLKLQASEGWSHTEDLLPTTEFSGSTNTAARVELDLAQIAAQIQRIETEVGFNADAYTATVVPTVHIRGTAGGAPVEDTYTASFPMGVDLTEITPDANLVYSDTNRIGETVSKTNTISGFPVPAIRWVSVSGAILALIGAAVFGGLLLRRLSRDETAMIRARYGSMLVSVASVQRTTVRRIRVASMQDLVRVAQKDSRTILHENGGATHRYFIDDGSVSYEYEATAPGAQAASPIEKSTNSV